MEDSDDGEEDSDDSEEEEECLLLRRFVLRSEVDLEERPFCLNDDDNRPCRPLPRFRRPRLLPLLESSDDEDRVDDSSSSSLRFLFLRNPEVVASLLTLTLLRGGDRGGGSGLADHTSRSQCLESSSPPGCLAAESAGFLPVPAAPDLSSSSFQCRRCLQRRSRR